MRIIEPTSLPSVNAARVCEAENCSRATREGKPFCLKHVTRNPHARRVTLEIALRESEDARMRSGDITLSDVNIAGITARAILQDLSKHGTRTKQRLCRELNIDSTVLNGYIRAMVKKGLVMLGRTNRGSETVSLLAPFSQSSPCTHSSSPKPHSTSQT